MCSYNHDHYINNLDSDNIGGSVADLRSKKKGSQSSLSKLKGNVGGSLMNIGSKQTGIKKFTDSSMYGFIEVYK